jgi:FtsH-binding integral membrane protein
MATGGYRQERSGWENVFPASFSSSSFDLSAMLKANNISYRVQNHLKNVYLAMAGTMLSAVAGTVFYLYTHLSPLLSMFAMMALMVGLMFESPSVPAREKLPRLMLFGFFQGASIGNLVELGLHVSPMLVAEAFFMTTLTFVCFAAVATLSERRSMLYMYGLLSSAVSWLLFASFANFFFQSTALFSAELYLGLAVFIGYVCADSQMIIERADLGDQDYVRHALELFLDFVAIFVRILIIFLKSRGDSERNEARRKRRE